MYVMMKKHTQMDMEFMIELSEILNGRGAECCHVEILGAINNAIYAMQCI